MSEDLFYKPPTPIQPIHSSVAEKAGVQWVIKRDDRIDPQISGNKWRKLKYNLQCAKEQGYKTLLTFGGAYSNHLYAVAAAGSLFGFETIGIIRGQEFAQLSPTLQFAQSCHMQLELWPREEYRLKEKSELFKQIQEHYDSFYMIPEGGSNALAVKGCTEIIEEIDIPFNYVSCACGTGGTIAGLIAGLHDKNICLGIPVLKGGDFLKSDIQELLSQYYLQEGKTIPPFRNWQLETNYHFGGYAKTTPELISFIHRFEQENNFLIDQVYTAKMLAGIEDLILQGRFKRGDTIISIHTGGLQGRLPQLSNM
ncbi:1-aminocyclopropane-1-carboxylate deaminase/D-cysteine desulfhydrase [Xanthocytophaga agilis]|uniref:Pyridoxal-phosphate dependent enzyme n=1 Tax=Xanthocytophaga agilis TaxID=3048010 RepID=A0AAE3UHI2_9BACT|nr:pyridoxal-phosphate dependent enzyme [Xanthocytophaga agilis]MDJ1505485.1 pyridoxal-phosphate dependent enzyme [Xanthocytophaga agilis]